MIYLLIVLQAIDVLSTYLALTKNKRAIEGNPIVRALLDKYGFLGLILAKIVLALMQYGTWYYGYLPDWLILILVVPYILICANNFRNINR